MEEFSLKEICSKPTYRTDYTIAKANSICVRCRGLAVAFRDAASRLEYRISALCQQCQDQCFSLTEKKR
jgi:hypothetical protein